MTASGRSDAVVLDASVALALLKGEPAADDIRRAIRAWQVAGTDMVVPGLFWLEIINILGREGRTASEILAALHELEEAGITTIEPDRAVRLLVVDACERHHLTAYDALYLALGEVVDGRIVTADRALGAAAGSRARIPGTPGWDAIHEQSVAYTSEPTWPRWSGASAYLAKLRADARAGRAV